MAKLRKQEPWLTNLEQPRICRTHRVLETDVGFMYRMGTSRDLQRVNGVTALRTSEDS
jgi:hypothetical protein